MLGNPQCARWTVSAIVLEAGFGDVSYFNRRSRRRYGIRPSDVRTGARSKA
jgi:AraC-like DNA-binding protein